MTGASRSPGSMRHLVLAVMAVVVVIAFWTVGYIVISLVSVVPSLAPSHKSYVLCSFLRTRCEERTVRDDTQRVSARRAT